LHEAVLEQFLVGQATQAGLTVTTEELQRAADFVRRRQGLTSAEQTLAWLSRQQLSVVEFEDALERDLLIEKFKDHLFRDRIPAHFEQHRAQYDRLRLRQLTVPREDLARELLSQVSNEGRDLAALVEKHRADRPDGGSPSVTVLMRRQLLPAAAAALPSKVGEVGGPVATPRRG
jgi:hypothetical protein